MGPYVFLSAPFEDAEFFDFARAVVQEATALRSEDGRIAASQDLRAHVLGLIDHAEFVIADLTAMNRNVLYESGYAAGIQKPTLLCVQRGVEIPSDLNGLKQIRYVQRDDHFRKELGEHLRWLVAQADLGVLRSMLEAPSPQPVYILASPWYPKARTPETIQYEDTRTFGDNLGVLGLISDFASLWGPGRGVELISAQYGPHNLLSRDLSLCLIGSPRVNPYVERALETMQEATKRWVFCPTQVKTPTGAKTRMILYDTRWAKRTPLLGEKLLTSRERKDGWRADYGLLLRGPHPWAPGRMITSGRRTSNRQGQRSGMVALYECRRSAHSKRSPTGEQAPRFRMVSRSRTGWAGHRPCVPRIARGDAFLDLGIIGRVRH